LVNVAPGDQLTGIMTLTDQNGALFSYTSEFDGMPETQRPIYNVEELTFADETLEAYGITGRDDLPASPGTVFSAIDLQTVAGGAAVQWLMKDDLPAANTSIRPLVNSGTNGSFEIRY
jgi:hypothetical protein